MLPDTRPTAVDVVHGHGERARRTAAALLFPIWHKETGGKTDVTRIMDLVIRAERQSATSEDIPVPDDRECLTTITIY